MRALIFDLDGTLVDTVYAHVFAWQRAFEETGIAVEAWRIHRHIGMDGDLLIRALVAEPGWEITEEATLPIKKRHGELFAQLLPEHRALPGAKDLLEYLAAAGVPFGIATSSHHAEIENSLEVLGVPGMPGVGGQTVVIERGDVARSKPEPDAFIACRERLGIDARECCVVGDTVWDMLAATRAGMLGVGVLTGGYGEDELFKAGAHRVYRDAAQLQDSLYELGFLI